MLRPPFLLMDLETIFEVVFLAAWMILAPASWCWFLPEKARDWISPLAPGPRRKTAGYFMVKREPMLQSSQNISAFS